MFPTIQAFTEVLTANATLALPAHGTFVYVRSATGEFEISFDGGKGGPGYTGIGYESDQEFGKIWLKDTSGASNTIKLIVMTNGRVYDQQSQQVVEVVDSTGLSTTADKTVQTTCTSPLVAANSSRKEIILQAAHSNTNNIFVGDSNVGTGRGVELAPGEPLTLATTAAIYAVVASGTETLHIVEVTE